MKPNWKKICKDRYGCSFIGFLRGNYSYHRIEHVRVWGKPEICLRYVSRKSLELIIVHKKCLENFRVSFGDFRNEKRKTEKCGKCSGTPRRGYYSLKQIFLLLSITSDCHNFFVRSPI